MKIVTDIKTIERLAKEKEEENFGFRSILKSGDISRQKIDLIVHKIYEKIAPKIDCQACGNCCSVMNVVLEEQDIVRLAEYLQLEQGDFVSQYVVQGEGKPSLKKNPCPFLEEKQCSVYAIRPRECQCYPHILDCNFTQRLIGIIHNTAVCPLAYNVYEELKKEIWMMNDSFEDPEDEEDL